MATEETCSAAFAVADLAEVQHAARMLSDLMERARRGEQWSKEDAVKYAKRLCERSEVVLDNVDSM